jgi:DNA helicase HerA-like ATPase
LKTLQSDPRFAFMFPRVQARDTMVATLSRLFRVPVDGKPLTIIDLASVPSEVLNVVVSVLCRMTFDFALWSERAVPILLVCEEAHRYCPLDSRAGFEPAKRALARIAKEGRKYGISLCVVSQRPSELLPAVLSQCNTIFALRMSNNADQDFVRGALRESTTGLLNFLPTLRNSEAIIIGEGVAVPVRVRIDDLPEEYRPLSGTAKFSQAWVKDVADPKFLATVVERWRGARS